MADFYVRNHGTIVTIQPLSEAAQEWWDTHVNAEPGEHYVEHRYATDILIALHEEGFILDGVELIPHNEMDDDC